MAPSLFVCLFALLVVCAADSSSSTGVAAFDSSSTAAVSSSAAVLVTSTAALTASTSSVTISSSEAAASSSSQVAATSSSAIAAITTPSSQGAAITTAASTAAPDFTSTASTAAPVITSTAVGSSGAIATTSTAAVPASSTVPATASSTAIAGSNVTSTAQHGNATASSTAATSGNSTANYSSTASFVRSSSTAAAPVQPVTSVIGFNVLNVTLNLKDNVNSSIGNLVHAVQQNVTGSHISLFGFSSQANNTSVNITFGGYSVQQISSYSWTVYTVSYVNTTNTTYITTSNTTLYYNATTNTTSNVTTYTTTAVNTTILVPVTKSQNFTVVTLQVLISITTAGPTEAVNAASVIKNSVLALFNSNLGQYNVTLGAFFCDSSAGYSTACPGNGFTPIYYASTVVISASGVAGSTGVVPPSQISLIFGFDVIFVNADSATTVKGLLSAFWNQLPSIAGCSFNPSTVVSNINDKVLTVYMELICSNSSTSKYAASALKTFIQSNTQINYALNATYPGHFDQFFCGSQAYSFDQVCPSTGFVPFVVPSSTGIINSNTGANSGGDSSGLSQNAKIGIGVGVGGGGLLILIIIISCCCCKGKRSNSGGTELMGSA